MECQFSQLRECIDVCVCVGVVDEETESNSKMKKYEE
jgi:hypothetical protein